MSIRVPRWIIASAEVACGMTALAIGVVIVLVMQAWWTVTGREP